MGMWVCWLSSNGSRKIKLSTKPSPTKRNSEAAPTSQMMQPYTAASTTTLSSRRRAPRGNQRRNFERFQKLPMRYSGVNNGIHQRQHTLMINFSTGLSGRGTSPTVVGSRSCQPVHL